MTAPGRSFATTRPVAVLVVFVAAVVFGYFSYGNLPVQLMPDLSYPTITVRTEYPGAAPEEVENDISRPVEEALGVVSGLRRVSSVSRVDVSDVVLEFSWDTDMSEAVQDTLERLDLVVLPEEAEPSLVLRFDPSLDPVMELSLSSSREEAPDEAELRRIRRVAELQVKRRLEPLTGVAAVRVRGGLEEEIHVQADARRLAAAGLSVGDLLSRLQQENVNVAGGTIKEGRTDYMVRTVNEFASLDEIRETLLTIIDGREVRIRDVATVEMSHREREMVTHTDGRTSIQIDVFQEADANVVDLAHRVRAELDSSRGAAGGQEAPSFTEELLAEEQARIDIVADRSLFIESSIDEVRNTAIVGGLLAVLVLFLFLGKVRPTLIIGASIPVSLMVTFVPLQLLGASLNIMSLGGLALGIGMLVDSSIVVLESIHRCREDGMGLEESAVAGTRDVAGAVTASTLTTIGVFLPMVFVDGVAGQAFDDLGLAVVLSLLVALVVALLLIPMLASRDSAASLARAVEGTPAAAQGLFHFAATRAAIRDLRRAPRLWQAILGIYLALKIGLVFVLEVVSRLILLLLGLPRLLWQRALRRVLVPVARGIVAPAVYVTGLGLDAANRVYPRVIRWALDHTKAVLTIAAACGGVLWLSLAQLDSELLPETHQAEFTLEISLPAGTPLEDTVATLAPVERAILAERDHIERLIVQYGYDPRSAQSDSEGEHTARFKLILERGRDNEATERLVAGRIRTRLRSIPDLETRLTRPVLFSFKTPIEIEVYGDNLRDLRETTDLVRAEVAALDLVTDVEQSLRRGAPEVQITYDRERLMTFGLDTDSVASLVRDQVRGRSSTRYSLKDRRIPIVVRLRERDRESIDDLRRMVVDPGSSGRVQLDAVADLSLGEGPSEIRRIDSQRVAIVRANLAQGVSLGHAVSTIEERLDQRIDWQEDQEFAITGQNEEWERSRDSLLFALALSIFLVYVVMAAQFESLVFPLVIMVSIPLAFVGTFVVLAAASMSLSIVVFLGMIMLAGIVVNNAIVLVDYINILRRRGMAMRDAVLKASEVRLRPILMTTATTALGLVPMALGLGDGSEVRRPLAVTVISGLIASTALTLVVIPSFYVLADRARDWAFENVLRRPRVALPPGRDE